MSRSYQKVVPEAKAALDAAKEALEAQDFDTVSAKISEALDLVKETKDTIKAAAKAEKEETKADENKAEENKTEEKKDTAAPAATGSFPWIWVIIAAVVVCAVVIILVASKKKK